MNVAVSVHDGACEVHLVEVRDAPGSLLCRLFLQATRGGCQVQLDTSGPDTSLRVAEAPSTVLIGVRRPEPS